jgi:small GTP-binding protein
MISKKITLIGDFSAGKTSLIRRFVDNQFSDKYLSTIGVKISKKEIPTNTNIIQGLIWDIEGGTPTKPINKTYLRGMHGCIIVADITREETINSIESYIQIANEIVPNVPLVVALNKSDKIDEAQVKISLDNLQSKYENRYNIFDTSAKTGLNVENLFSALANNILTQ